MSAQPDPRSTVQDFLVPKSREWSLSFAHPERTRTHTRHTHTRDAHTHTSHCSPFPAAIYHFLTPPPPGAGWKLAAGSRPSQSRVPCFLVPLVSRSLAPLLPRSLAPLLPASSAPGTLTHHTHTHTSHSHFTLSTVSWRLLLQETGL